MNLTPMLQAFVVHFGEMGSRWGFNRTVGQIYALIILHNTSLTANDIADALGVSRGNVSMALKELQAWRLVKVEHKPGDRKDYYTSAGDIWEMARRVLEERRRREIDPTLSLLRDTLMENPANSTERYAQAQMQEIHHLLEQLSVFADEIQSVSPERLRTLLRVGSGVGKVLDFAHKLKPGKQNDESR